MAAPRSPPLRLLCRRSFHCTPRRQSSSPLFNLQGLSTSRESQWLAKASGLSRIEHSPGLQLLRSEAELQKAASQTISKPAGNTQNARDSKDIPRTQRLPMEDVEGSRPTVDTPSAGQTRAWMHEVRRDLDDLERALNSQSTARAGTNTGWRPAAESYRDLIHEQREALQTAHVLLERAQNQHQSDLDSLAVKLKGKEHMINWMYLFLVAYFIMDVCMVKLRRSTPSGDGESPHKVMSSPPEPQPETDDPDTSSTPPPATLPFQTPSYLNLNQLAERPSVPKSAGGGLFWSR